MSLAWHIAMFGRAKKIPDLQKVLPPLHNEGRLEKRERFRAFFMKNRGKKDG